MSDLEHKAQGKGKIERTSKGQFAPGVSGNPAGRPRSSVNALLAQAREAALNILPKVIEQAEGGDVFSQKMLLEVGMPKVKPMPERMNTLPGFPHEETPRVQMMFLMGAMARGVITTDEARLYASIVSGMKDLPTVAWQARKVPGFGGIDDLFGDPSKCMSNKDLCKLLNGLEQEGE